MKQRRMLGALLLVALGIGGSSAPAQALDLEAVALLGTGVDTGDADNNPYALSLGGAVELTIFGIVGGLRATRSFGTSCDGCREVPDLRSLGGDLGVDWELSVVHLSPRFGFGQVHARDAFDAAYFEPGGVVELELGMWVAGLDVRYRFVTDHDEASGALAYLRAGLRL